MDKVKKKSTSPKKYIARFPLGGAASMAALLEANGKFRNEILAFKPQELLGECK